MYIDQAKKVTFKTPTVNDWKNAALTSLKNADLEDLYTDTYENIKLSPLYVKEHIDYGRIDQYPGEGSFLRGFYHPEKKQSWRIAQKLKMGDWEQLKLQLKLSLERGQEAVAFDPMPLDKIDDVSFKELNEIVTLDQMPLLIFAGSKFDFITEKLLDEDINVIGALAADIVSAELSEGFMLDPDSLQMEDWASRIKRLDRKFLHLRTILIDTKPYKEAGAQVIQELGISLALAVFYIERMKKAGWAPAKTVGKMIFRFSIGSDFYMELSKFRAFRVLWKTVADAYGVKTDEQAVPISAETSYMTKSVLDPYVNMLRAGNEAFAGILGGIDYLHVGSFDELSGQPADFSMRIAGNTQLLLKEESLLDQVADPAGGSYYIESLTSDLVNEGWGFFQEIDRNGGIIDILRSEWLHGKIKEIAANRMTDMETRKRRSVGVNVYAVPGEQIRFPNEGDRSVHFEKGKIKVEPLQSIRLAEKFEGLRQRAHNLAQKGKKPAIGLICLGELKAYKPYADFVTGILAAAGIQAVWSEGFEDLDDMKGYIEESGEKAFCLCGPHSLYSKFAAQIGQWAKEKVPGIRMDIAGHFSEEELSSFRMDGMFYSGQNIFEKLNGLLERWEADVNG